MHSAQMEKDRTEAVESYEFQEFATPVFVDFSEEQGIHDVVLPSFDGVTFSPARQPQAESWPVFEDADSDQLVAQEHPQTLSLSLQAQEEAERILAAAREEAERIKDEAAKQGYTLGQKEGYSEGKNLGRAEALEEHREQMLFERQAFLVDVKAAVEKIDVKREELLDKYKDELRDLAVSVAEKIINISLKSSGKIIEKMIVNATEEIKEKQWARIYISKQDADLMMEGDMNILDAVKRTSAHVKVIVRENEPPGTCIIEFPDQIIDASVKTQLENVKSLLESSS